MKTKFTFKARKLFLFGFEEEFSCTVFYRYTLLIFKVFVLFLIESEFIQKLWLDYEVINIPVPSLPKDLNQSHRFDMYSSIIVCVQNCHFVEHYFIIRRIFAQRSSNFYALSKTLSFHCLLLPILFSVWLHTVLKNHFDT